MREIESDGRAAFWGLRRHLLSVLWFLSAASGTTLPALLSAADRFPDVVVTDLDSLWVFLGDGKGGLIEPVQYFIESEVEPWSVTAADLTGDGAPELVSANRLAAHVAVFTNRGDGSFEQPPKIIPTAVRPYDVDAGDLDSDGDVDLLITCNFDPGEVLLLFNGGGGDFNDREVLLPDGEAFNSVLVDLDGKKGLDLVVVRNSAADLAVYLNEGDGSFTFLTNVPAGTDPKAVRAGHLNDDAFADVAVTNDAGGRVSVFHGDGQGGLRLDRGYAVGVNPRELAIVDLNTDERQDLVVAGGRGSNYVARLLGSADGTFGAPKNFPTGPRPNSVDSADFDLDGKADVAVANWSLDNEPLASLTLLFGDGEGEFPRQTDFTPPFGFRKITALAAGQFNPPLERPFLRGDATGEGRITITDPIAVLNHLFLSGILGCPDGGDADDNGVLEITDALRMLGWMFLDGPPFSAPFPQSGLDPTPDSLGCGE